MNCSDDYQTMLTRGYVSHEFADGDSLDEWRREMRARARQDRVTIRTYASVHRLHATAWLPNHTLSEAEERRQNEEAVRLMNAHIEAYLRGKS